MYPESVTAELAQIEKDAASQKDALLAFYVSYTMIDWSNIYSISYSPGVKSINIHALDWLKALRELRPYALGEAGKSVFPLREGSNVATVVYHLQIGGTEVCIFAAVEDYTEYLTPGMTCKRRAQTEVVECS